MSNLRKFNCRCGVCSSRTTRTNMKCGACTALGCKPTRKVTPLQRKRVGTRTFEYVV